MRGTVAGRLIRCGDWWIVLVTASNIPVIVSTKALISMKGNKWFDPLKAILGAIRRLQMSLYTWLNRYVATGLAVCSPKHLKEYIYLPTTRTPFKCSKFGIIVKNDIPGLPRFNSYLVLVLSGWLCYFVDQLFILRLPCPHLRL